MDSLYFNAHLPTSNWEEKRILPEVVTNAMLEKPEIEPKPEPEIEQRPEVAPETQHLVDIEGATKPEVVGGARSRKSGQSSIVGKYLGDTNVKKKKKPPAPQPPIKKSPTPVDDLISFESPDEYLAKRFTKMDLKAPTSKLVADSGFIMDWSECKLMAKDSESGTLLFKRPDKGLEPSRPSEKAESPLELKPNVLSTNAPFDPVPAPSKSQEETVASDSDPAAILGPFGAPCGKSESKQVGPFGAIPKPLIVPKEPFCSVPKISPQPAFVPHAASKPVSSYDTSPSFGPRKTSWYDTSPSFDQRQMSNCDTSPSFDQRQMSNCDTSPSLESKKMSSSDLLSSKQVSYFDMSPSFDPRQTSSYDTSTSFEPRQTSSYDTFSSFDPRNMSSYDASSYFDPKPSLPQSYSNASTLAMGTKSPPSSLHPSTCSTAARRPTTSSNPEENTFDTRERDKLRQMLSDLRKDPFDEDLENNDGSFFPCEFCGDPYPVEFIMRHQVQNFSILNSVILSQG